MATGPLLIGLAGTRLDDHDREQLAHPAVGGVAGRVLEGEVPVPGAVRLEARCHILAERKVRLPFYGDSIVIIEGNKLTQSQGARQGADFVGYPLHQAAVAKEGIGVVIDDLVAGLVDKRGPSHPIQDLETDLVLTEAGERQARRCALRRAPCC